MRSRYVTSLILSAMLCTLPAQAATEKATTRMTEKIEALKSSPLKKELQALDKAKIILEGVSDEKSAKDAHRKIQMLLRSLPPLLGGSGKDLELLAEAQNMVSEEMWKRVNEPYFKTTNMQEIWTLLIDQFSRPAADK